MCFMVVRLSPSIHLLDVRQLPKPRLVIFYWARRRHFDANQPRAADPNGSWQVKSG